MKRQILQGLLLAAIACLLIAGLEIARWDGLIPRPGRGGPAPSGSISSHRLVTLQPGAIAHPGSAGDGASPRKTLDPSNHPILDSIVEPGLAYQEGADGGAVENLPIGG